VEAGAGPADEEIAIVANPRHSQKVLLEIGARQQRLSEDFSVLSFNGTTVAGGARAK
jgi:hypothetical protein